MTAGDALDRLPSAAGDAVLVHRVDRVLAARRIEAALPAEQPAERHAVQQHEVDQDEAHGEVTTMSTMRAGAAPTPGEVSPSSRSAPAGTRRGSSARGGGRPR